MNWYYVAGGERQGPVSEAEFLRLIEQAVVTGETLVWKEGMAGWQPYKELAAPGAPPPPPAATTSAGAIVCAQCGKAFGLDEVVRIGGLNVCPQCKPIALQRMSEGVVASGASEEIRKAHISHEASIRSVGVLYLLGSAFLGLAGLFGMTAGTGEALVIGVFFLALALLQGWAGMNLRKLDRRARIPTGILSGIGLLGFPLGTLINGYILYLVFSQKGNTIFSDDYKRVIAETPHVRYKTSIIVWIFLILLVLLLAAIVVFAVLGSRR